MKLGSLILLASLAAQVGLSQAVVAQEAAPAVTEPSTTVNVGWKNELKTEYKLTDEQIAAFEAKGVTGQAAIRVASLAKGSGKTTDEVMAMRIDQKMGWGKIAKTLGVHPSTMGRAVSSFKKSERRERVERSGASHPGKGMGHGAGADRGHGNGKGKGKH
ncbi:MAG: hypothetical protein V4736_12920 [Bdellovibrionota bacterium]